MYNQEAHDLYCSLNIINVIKSGRMRWQGMLCIWGRGEMHTVVYWEDMKDRDHLEDSDVGGRMVLKYIFKIYAGSACTVLIWLGTGLGIELL